MFLLVHLFGNKKKKQPKKNKRLLPLLLLFLCRVAAYQAQMCELLSVFFSGAAVEIGYKSLLVTRFLLLLVKKSFKLEGNLRID